MDVRVIAATHQNLEGLVAEGRFRADLLHRLDVVRLQLPPLRDRRADVPQLAENFLAVAARKLGAPAKRFATPALQAMRAHDWPGNVRELENVCWRLAALAPGETITTNDLQGALSSGAFAASRGQEWDQVLAVAQAVVWPQLPSGKEVFITLVAVLGTTISPYLFFWQAAQEVEDKRAGAHTGAEVQRELRRIRFDTVVGMTFSNGIAFCIMLSTAVTLFTAGVHDIQTSAQAAEALRPVAGNFAYLLFSLGIIGTGMLAVPVLAGSAAYAVSDALGWHGSLGLNLRRGEGRGFYGVIVAATVVGVVLCFTPTDPVKELFWSAVINGVVAVPIMALLMSMATNPRVMGAHVIGRRVRWLGWAATALMGVTVLGMFVA